VETTREARKQAREMKTHDRLRGRLVVQLPDSRSEAMSSCLTMMPSGFPRREHGNGEDRHGYAYVYRGADDEKAGAKELSRALPLSV